MRAFSSSAEPSGSGSAAVQLDIGPSEGGAEKEVVELIAGAAGATRRTR